MRKLILIVLLVTLLALTAAPAAAQPIFTADIFSDIGNIINNGITSIGNLISGIWSWIQGAVNWVVTAVQNIIRFIVSIIEGIWNFALTVVNFIAGIINAIVQFVTEAVAIVTLAANIVITVIISVATFVFEVLGVFLQLITNYYNAGATPVPGIPLCISNPTAYDLCAFWYIADYTLLAPGTVGALIPGLSLLILDIIIVFFVLRMVLRFAREVEEMFSGF